MKKVFFSVCCTFLIAGFSVAQQGTTITPPAAPTPDETPAVVVAEATETVQVQEAAKPSEDIAAQEPAAAPVAEKAVVVEQAAPVVAQEAPVVEVVTEEVIVDNGSVLNAPMIESTPLVEGQYLGAPVDASYFGDTVMAPAGSVVGDPFAAPVVASTCDDCNNSRRGIVRTVTTRGRSVLTRVRGLVGRRR